MNAAAAVAEAVAIVASIHDMQQPAGRTAIGIIVDRKQSTERIDAGRVRIPEPGGDAHESRSVEFTTVDTAPFALAGERLAIAASEFVVGAEVLTQADVHVPG